MTNPQSISQRALKKVRTRINSRIANQAATAGGSYLEDSSLSGSLHFDYSYVDSQVDNTTSGVGPSQTSAFALGGGFVKNGTYFDFTYEFSREDVDYTPLFGPGVSGGGEIDNHTFTGSIAKDLEDWLYVYGIAGYSNSSDKSQITLGPVNNRMRLDRNTNGDLYFFNPGFGTVWPMGDLTITAGASYLYQNVDSNQTGTLPGVANSVNGDMGVFIGDLAAMYFLTQDITLRGSLSFNQVAHESVSAAVPFDDNWTVLGAEAIYNFNHNSSGYVGYYHDLWHDVYETQMIQVGAQIDF